MAEAMADHAGAWLAGPLEHGPPAFDAAEGAWMLTRYDDAAALLRAKPTAAVEVHPGILRIGARAGRDYGSLALLLSGVLFFRDPPHHTAVRAMLRRLLVRIGDRFAAPAVAPLVRTLVDEARETGALDAMPAICGRLPVQVMAQALDLSEATAAVLHRDGQGVVDAWQRGMPLRDYDRLQRQAAGIEAVLLADIAAARSAGTGGLALLLAENAAGPGLDDRALAACVFFLILAGIETTAALLGSAMHLMLSQPAMQGALRRDPNAIEPFVEEVLRIAPPLRRAAARRLLAPLRLGCVEVPEGALAIASIEHAQHDPAHFADPSRFLPGRAGPVLLAFGAGPHACLGGPIARLEARLLLQALLRSGAWRLADPRPDWESHVSFRRLRSLRIAAAA
jgi:cytochrome P450